MMKLIVVWPWILSVAFTVFAYLWENVNNGEEHTLDSLSPYSINLNDSLSLSTCLFCFSICKMGKKYYLSIELLYFMYLTNAYYMPEITLSARDV